MFDEANIKIKKGQKGPWVKNSDFLSSVSVSELCQGFREINKLFIAVEQLMNSYTLALNFKNCMPSHANQTNLHWNHNMVYIGSICYTFVAHRQIEKLKSNSDHLRH